MKALFNMTALTAGMAIFAMFFGAGNVVYPLALGKYAQSEVIIAIVGFLLTAVVIPFAGLVAMTLFEGDYRQFFARLGRMPGFIVALLIMGLIGPFGALPRCIALSFATVSSYIPNVSLPLFSAFSCLVIFLLSVKRNNIVDIIGGLLTPILIATLCLIIAMGLWGAPALPLTTLGMGELFFDGVKQGYQTMDLLGAFFFSSLVLQGVKGKLAQSQESVGSLLSTTVSAIIIGASLLALTYIGFSYVAAFHSEGLANRSAEQLVGAIAVAALGPHAGVVVSAMVALACLTTAIALATVFAEFVQSEFSRYKISYSTALTATMLVAFLISTLNFNVIVTILGPILQWCYPALIALTFINIAYKLYGLQREGRKNS